MKNSGLNKRFLRRYYCSSLLPSFVLILVYYVMTTLRNYIVLNEYEKFPSSEDWFVMGVLMFVILIMLYHTYFMIKSFKKGPSSPVPLRVQIRNEKNPNTMNTFLSVIVSIISLFGITDNPIPTLIIIVLIYYMLYKLVMKSTDYYPNITLTMCGWNGIVGEDKKIISTKVWIFYKDTTLANKKLTAYNNVVSVRSFGYSNGYDIRMCVLDE